MCSYSSLRDLHSFPTRRSSDLQHELPLNVQPEPDGRPCVSVKDYRSLKFSDTHPELHLFLRSEEHTSELQSLRHLVCRLLLEKKNVAPELFGIGGEWVGAELDD